MKSIFPEPTIKSIYVTKNIKSNYFKSNFLLTEEKGKNSFGTCFLSTDRHYTFMKQLCLQNLRSTE